MAVNCTDNGCRYHKLTALHKSYSCADDDIRGLQPHRGGRSTSQGVVQSPTRISVERGVLKPLLVLGCSQVDGSPVARNPPGGRALVKLLTQHKPDQFRQANTGIIHAWVTRLAVTAQLTGVLQRDAEVNLQVPSVTSYLFTNLQHVFVFQEGHKRHRQGRQLTYLDDMHNPATINERDRDLHGCRLASLGYVTPVPHHRRPLNIKTHGKVAE
jgi:hypothetical protein